MYMFSLLRDAYHRVFGIALDERLGQDVAGRKTRLGVILKETLYQVVHLGAVAEKRAID